MYEYFLIAIALLPAIVLCGYVFKKDRVEKEPLGLLLKLFIFGAISYVPAAFAEVFLGEIIDAFFINGTYTYLLVDNFIGIALVEEGIKFIVLIWLTRRNKAFNSFFDGLIYSVFVSLGFAALENVLYVLEGGIYTGIMRAILSVPGHMFFAVMMGYHYSLWHITEKAAEKEAEIESRKAPFDSSKEKALCLIVPTLAHGFYDFCCSAGAVWATFLLYAFVIFMYVHCFGRIKKMSNADGENDTYVNYLLAKKYPEIF